MTRTILYALPWGMCLVTLTACSSSSTSITAPSSDSRCSLTATAEPRSAEAMGATGSLKIIVNRECSWTIRSEVDWIAFTTPATGQGEATIPFTIAANAAVQPRRGQLVVNDQRLEIAQAPSPCVFTLDADRQAFGPDGGTHPVRVAAQSGCRWSATGQTSWISVSGEAAGDGAGIVTIAVARNESPEMRSGSLTIAGHTFAVSQAAAAPFPPTPTPGPPPSPAPVPPSPGPSPPPPAPTPPAPTPTPTPTPAPAPTPPPTPTPAPAPTPPPTPTPTPAPTPPPTPTPTPTPTPAPDPSPVCSFSLSSVSASLTHDEREGSVDVRASAGSCAWTAVSPVSWIELSSGASGRGNSTVRYEVSKNNAATARTATLTIAGLAFVVTQAGKVEEVEILGRVSDLTGGCPAITFTLDGQTVRTTAATRFTGGTCAQLDRHMKVEVNGVRQLDGSVLAIRLALDLD